jgi:hypothetical protein
MGHGLALESYRQLLLDVAELLFVVGVVAGFLSPLYLVMTLPHLHTFPWPLLTSSIISLVAAFLSLNCYGNVKKRKLIEAGFKGVIAGALLIATGNLLVGFLVLVAGIISYIYRRS